MVGFAFSETDEAADEITRLFDFVWPTSIALWNLRWQVSGFLSAVPDATYEQVASRFVAGSGIHGADIRAMVTRTSWDEQQSRFAEFVLTNAFAIYEGWARRLFEHCKNTGMTGMSDRDLYREGDGIRTGLPAFITKVCSKPSIVMQSAFQGTFSSHKKVFIAQQTAMLKCYKYFKELRNCHIHNHGLADQKLVDAYTEFQILSSPGSLKIKEPLECHPAVLGKKNQISLRGVVGFCDIVLRLMITVDAQISGSMAAEDAILNRIKNGTSGPRLTLSSINTRSHQQIRKVFLNVGLPKPRDPDAIRDLLLHHHLVNRCPLGSKTGTGCQDLE